MIEKKQTQITILATILGILSLSFIVVASTGVVISILITPTPVRGRIRVNKTVQVIKASTSINVGPGTPYPTLNPTQKAINATAHAKPLPNPKSPPTSTPEPVYLKTAKRLSKINLWREMLGVILMLMLIASGLLFNRLYKQDQE